ncbi:multicopper oxidase [Raphidocelis subcapitata]|uniref:Multicopper oxidase n=1 Tax=Raphidocelis subcapitata TaxID=307507 RepID=A0A2V0NJQ0_9CHLO|nr:multicopper oxidase [Raphidocelis subcapitata]|eukprot:GBF87461.1 multicopper oxidase [Raphidocelis subcapitata]
MARPALLALLTALLVGRATCQMTMTMAEAPPGGAGRTPAPAATAGRRVVCPSLPAPGPSVKRFSLTAAKIQSKTQTLAYNGTAVGPLIRIRLGDEVQIDVTNKDIPEGTSVHWHGQAGPAGTMWYHSHTGEQYGDGLRGPLIVDDPADPHKGLHDTDLDAHVLMLADVYDTTVAQQLKDLESGGMGAMAAAGGLPDAQSMGGVPEQPQGPMGKMQVLCPPEVLNQDLSDSPWYGVQVNGQGWVTDPKTMQRAGQPLVLTVEQGKRHRLRLIGGMSSWALRVGVQGHGLKLIALDGRPVRPADAKSLLLTSGERADVVLHADQPVGNYWMDVSTISGQNSPVIVHYKGAPDPLGDKGFLATARADTGCAVGSPQILDLKNATLRAGPGLPQPPKGANKQFTIYLPDASSTVPPRSFLTHIAKAGNVHGLAPGSIPARGPSCPPAADGQPGKYCWSLNWNVYEPPSTVALLPGAKAAPRTYNLELSEGDVVDLLLINPSLMVHPMHLHGTGFWVLATGNGAAANSTDMLAPGVALNLADPPLRDTVPVPQAVAAPAGGKMGGMAGTTELAPGGFGFAILRFRATNPGVWSFHCHIELHASSGMFMTLTTRPKSNGTWALPDNLLCA